MRIYHNISALTAYNALNATSNAMQKSIRQLSTGLRINSAADDAAGLAISEKMRAQIYGMEQAITNAQDGISLIQTAEGALSETHSILQRMRELAVQAANDTMTSEDRNYIQEEIDQLKDQIDMISTSTQFNKKKLLDGSSSGIWSSSDITTKAYIRGSLRQTDQFGETSAFEGNYKIQITAVPGQAQAQKTDIFKIKHENVVTDVMLNSAMGAKAVRVDKVPAGTYTLKTASSAATESYAVTGIYGFDSAGTATTTMTFTVGDMIAGEDRKIMFTYNGDNYPGDTVASGQQITIPAAAVGAASAATLIVTALNAIKTANAEALANVTFTDNGDGTITATSTDGVSMEVTLDDAGTAAGTIAFTTVPSSALGTSLTPATYLTAMPTVGETDSFQAIYTPNGGSATTVTFSVTADSTNTADTATYFNAIMNAAVAAMGSGAHFTYNTGTHYFATSDGSTFTSISLTGSATTKAETLTLTGDTSVDEDDAVTVVNFDDGTSAGVVKATVTNAARNASILFEVTAVDANNGTVTLNATSNLLDMEGDVSNKIYSGIVLTKDAAAVELGKILGISDTNSDAFTLALNDLTGFAVGNKFVYNVYTSGDTTVEMESTRDAKDAEDSSKEIDSWPYSWGKDLTRDGVSVKYGLNAADATNKEIHFRNFFLNDKNGAIYEGDVVLTTNSTEMTAGTTLTSLTAGYVGKVATSDTMLYDLDKFWNTSGVFMLEDPQTITITQGDGTKTSVTLYATDTLADLRAKLNDAIANGLGQAKYAVSNANQFVTFVDKPSADYGLETVGGTFVIRSLIAGEGGELAFSGEEELINALSLNVIQDSKENSFVASVYDAHTGATVANNVKVSGNTLVGIIHPNVDVEFDAMANIEAKWNENTKNFDLYAQDDPQVTTLHLVDNSMVFQVGANEGEDIAIDIGDMSATSLGVNRVIVTDRNSASGAISILDRAINRVSAQRAKLGAYQNALEYTVENLTTTSTNLTAAESRIRDTDMAATMMEFVKYQILNQSGTSMLAQANQLPQSVLSLLQ